MAKGVPVVGLQDDLNRARKRLIVQEGNVKSDEEFLKDTKMCSEMPVTASLIRARLARNRVEMERTRSVVLELAKALGQTIG